MALVANILLLLFLILGASLGPLLLAMAIATLSAKRGEPLSAWTIGLGLKSVYKPALTFNLADDDLTLKRRSYDEKHNTEYISYGGIFGGVKRYLFDPQNRIHTFYGTPFGFVEEIFGVVVDPRDCSLGRELRHEQENSQYEYRVERDGRYRESVKAVFGIPRGRVGTRLPDVVRLFGGSFDSQVVDWIRDIYEESQSPKSSQASALRLMLPIGALIGMILLGLFAAGQGGGGGGGGGGSSPPVNSSTINVGASLAFLLVSASSIRAINWRDVAVTGGFSIVSLLLAAGLVLVFPVTYPLMGIPLPLGLWAMVALGVGAVLPMFVAFWFGRSLGAFGIGLGKLYIIIGLLGYKRPVFDFDDGEYYVREYDPDEWAVEPKWYRFAFSRIGVGFLNDESNWPKGTTLSRPKVKAMADGGYSTQAPTDHAATDLIQLGNINGFVPEEPDPDDVFVRTDRTTGWFDEAGQDRRLMVAALQAAKQEFGGGRGAISDNKILLATVFMALVGLVFDWVVFF